VSNSNSTRLHRCETQLQDFLLVTLNGVSIETLNAKPVPGKWSAHEQLAHLARYHQIFLQRIDRILTEQGPEFPRYRAEDDPEWPAWSGLPAPQLFARISSMRTKLMARLRSLSEEDFERIGVHPKFGVMSLALWLEFFLVHEAHHLYVVLQLVRGRQKPTRRPG
jgi:DinB superfamily